VVILHRGHEHSRRYRQLSETLALAGYAVFAWDARGHGYSPGRRGHAPGFAGLVRDADCFVRHISDTTDIPIREMAVVGNSVGSVVAATWMHDYAPPIRALVLGSPALRVRLYVPFAIPMLKLLLKFKPHATIKSYVKAALLTHDRVEAEAYHADPLITRDISVEVLIGLREAADRITADAGAIRCPVLMLAAGRDLVVDTGVQRRFFDGLASPVKKHVRYPEFYHDIFHEADRQRPIDETRSFIDEIFANGPLPADAVGDPETHDEFLRLAAPLPLFSPRRWGFGAFRLGLSIAGRLSEGVGLGFRNGFDSGCTLDYVYKNSPHGRGPLGRLIDRVYLNAIGWRGIRERKAILDDVLQRAIDASRVENPDRPVRLYDPAAGAGRYIIDAVRAAPDGTVEAELCDADPRSIDEGREQVAAANLIGVRFVHRDAFTARGAEAADPVDIAVVSGLYELIPDNERVRHSLSALAETVHPGGRLIYTNQPWHPQLEMIARTLVDRDGERWIMRRRRQTEMDALVSAAGFEKLATASDQFGIFNVSLARRS
jgi:alpha-beta hydrolase superfamily lysophospholipase/SAM-dependent methyltransferase